MIIRWYGAKVENVWQYSKVYPNVGHWDHENDRPTAAWDRWRDDGWARDWADRYPMGRGAKPICAWAGTLEKGKALDYIEARKGIYLPIYREAVRHTDAMLKLELTYEREGEIWLRDFDGYDHIALGMSLGDVLMDPNRKMGHAFVLAAMLEGEL